MTGRQRLTTRSVEVRVVPRIHPALADLVEFLVKRGLHFCKGATGSLDCGVTASSSLHRSSADTSVDTKTEKRIQSPATEMSTLGAGLSWR